MRLCVTTHYDISKGSQNKDGLACFKLGFGKDLREESGETDFERPCIWRTHPVQ